MSFVAEIKLNAKEDTHKTLVRMKCSEILTVPMCVTETKSPLGSLIDVDKVAVIVVNKETQLIIWSMALVSMIQGVSVGFGLSLGKFWLEWKT